MTGTKVPISCLTLNAACQPRAEMNQSTIDAYAEAMQEGATFDLVIVFRNGDENWLADGWHRVAAARQAGLVTIQADVRTGGQRDAILFAVGSNSTHGLPRTNADKRRAVMTLLDDPEWSSWSDSEIARRCAVSQPLVGKLRATTYNGFESSLRRGADGRVIDTTNIGGLPPAGVSLRTVRSDARALIADLDVAEDKRQMARLSRMPGDDQLGVAQKLADGKVHTVVQAIKRVRAEQFPSGLVPLPAETYRSIVVDPPWPVAFGAYDARTGDDVMDYATMSLEQIQSLDVASLAADDAILFLWTTHKFLPLAFGIADTWGFAHWCTLVWDKGGGFQPIGMPQLDCEFVLVCRRGSPAFITTKAFKTIIRGERREHSRKPAEFYDLLQRVAPEPRLDMFSRESHDGFESWGNEIGKFGADAAPEAAA